MEKSKKTLQININYNLLDEFCNINGFMIITDDILEKNNIYKELIYATDNNFTGKNVYPKDMPLIINKIVWKKIVKINNELKEHGLCLKIYDAYRPVEIQKIFWEDFYNSHGYYDETLVANPNKYGTHNITINAVDLFLVNIDGSDIELPCKFDDFTGKANIHYSNCSEAAKKNRDLLIHTAEKHGLIVNTDEWWHFYDIKLKEYGMKYDYSNSEFIPQKEKQVFILADNHN